MGRYGHPVQFKILKVSRIELFDRKEMQTNQIQQRPLKTARNINNFEVLVGNF